MSRYLVIVLFSILSVTGSAQTNDSLFAIHKLASWVIRYTVQPGENLHMIATRFYISDGALENANEADVIKKFQPGSVISIPVTAENYYVTKQTFLDMHEVYYHVVPKDDIGLLSTYAGITKAQMRSWNNLHGNTISPGEVLFIGWVKMISYDTTNPISELAYPTFRKKAMADTAQGPVPGGLDTVYNRQTNNGTNVLTEKGTAVFYDQTSRNNTYYAFHNATPHGSIIKVYNPSSGKTIYVRVLGPIPNTKLYANAIIGISSAAKEALGVTDNKAWCELSYSAN